VRIGSQVWTVENLRTTKFNDGTPIPNVTDAEAWKGLSTPGFCYYENNPEHGKKYGALYNWWAASSDKIAPKGWKVPTIEEQMMLRDCLIAIGLNFDGTKEGNKVAKAMTATTDWDMIRLRERRPRFDHQQQSGFTALPTGSRWNDGSFHAMGKSVYWWSTTKGNGEGSHMSSIHSRFAKYGNNQHHDRSGFCIRLLRDRALLSRPPASAERLRTPPGQACWSQGAVGRHQPIHDNRCKGKFQHGSERSCAGNQDGHRQGLH
jgi:uncharacterized protein (TIGR02145 family)